MNGAENVQRPTRAERLRGRQPVRYLPPFMVSHARKVGGTISRGCIYPVRLEGFAPGVPIVDVVPVLDILFPQLVAKANDIPVAM